MQSSFLSCMCHFAAKDVYPSNIANYIYIYSDINVIYKSYKQQCQKIVTTTVPGFARQFPTSNQATVVSLISAAH